MSTVTPPLDPNEQSKLLEMMPTFLCFFKPAVLASYRSEPHKYDLEISDFDGELQLTDSYSEELTDQTRREEGIRIRFGFKRLISGEYGIAALVHDFRQYSRGHVDRWLPFMLEPNDLSPLPDLRFESWAARNLFGSWDIENNLIDRIEGVVKLINAATIEAFGLRLFEFSENQHLSAPISENDHAYQDAHREVYAFLLDGLQKETIRQVNRISGSLLPKGENGTRKLLQASLPGIDSSGLWRRLDHVSQQRGLATHKVRPQARSFKAFDTFAADLSGIFDGLGDLLRELETVLSIDAEGAMARQVDLTYLQKIDRPMQNAMAVVDMDKVIGRTIARIEKGLRRRHEDLHGSDVVLIHFTDGSVLGLDVHSNAGNIAMDHDDIKASEFNTNIYAKFVPQSQAKP